MLYGLAVQLLMFCNLRSGVLNFFVAALVTVVLLEWIYIFVDVLSFS